MDWSTRVTDEAQMHEENSFLTLTFSDEYLPEDYSVNKRHMQLFMKRLREEVKVPIRFFGCGEYGGTTHRPHYHIIIFGYDFRSDRKLWSTRAGYNIYKSATLEKVWPFGLCEIGTVTPQSAQYIAKYVFKRATGDKAFTHYLRIHPLLGHEVRVRAEFILMSTRPGIGYAFYEKYRSDMFPRDYTVIDGKRRPVPKYYLNKEREAEQLRIKAERTRKAKKAMRLNPAEHETPRLMTKEQSAILRAQAEKRSLEDEL